MTEPNSVFWFLPDHLGRWFWAPLPFYGALGMYFLYKLGAPEERMGRIIRVLLGMAFISLIFSPILTGLGPWAIHMLAIGTVLTVMQFYLRSLSEGKIVRPTSPTVIERIADRVSQPHNTMRMRGDR